MRVIDLAAVVRMIPVQPDLPRIGRIGVGQPERTARRYRVRVADRTREPAPASQPSTFPGYALPWAYGIYTG
jgi:hypothetical protein